MDPDPDPDPQHWFFPSVTTVLTSSRISKDSLYFLKGVGGLYIKILRYYQETRPIKKSFYMRIQLIVRLKRKISTKLKSQGCLRNV